MRRLDFIPARMDYLPAELRADVRIVGFVLWVLVIGAAVGLACGMYHDWQGWWGQ